MNILSWLVLGVTLILGGGVAAVGWVLGTPDLEVVARTTPPDQILQAEVRYLAAHQTSGYGR